MACNKNVQELATDIAAKANASVTITAGNGLTGGGDLSANRTLAVGAGSGIAVAADAVSVDINGLTAEATIDQAADYVMVYDASAGALRKALIGNAVYTSGTFTPVIKGDTSDGVGTYTTQLGAYTKIGDRVFFDIRLIWTAHTGTGDIFVDGLPFTVKSGSMLPACAIYANTLNYGAGKQLAALVNAGTTTILLRAVDPAGGNSLEIAMDTSAQIIISGSYQV